MLRPSQRQAIFAARIEEGLLIASGESDAYRLVYDEGSGAANVYAVDHAGKTRLVAECFGFTDEAER